MATLRTVIDRVFGSAWHVNHKDIMDGIWPSVDGTVEANKPAVLDANKALDVVRTASLRLGTSGSETTVTATGAELNTLASILSTQVEIDRAADVSARLIAGGSSLSLTVALHDGKTVLLDTASGTTLTLPTAAATGARIRVVCSVTATSNSHVIKCGAAADIMYGSLLNSDTDTADATIAWAAEVADAFDTITLNRGTTGQALIGDWFEFEDVGTNKWAVRGNMRSSGTVATPFSSAV